MFISLSNNTILPKTTAKFMVIIINFHSISGRYHVYSTSWSLSKTGLLSSSLSGHFAQTFGKEGFTDLKHLTFSLCTKSHEFADHIICTGNSKNCICNSKPTLSK